MCTVVSLNTIFDLDTVTALGGNFFSHVSKLTHAVTRDISFPANSAEPLLPTLPERVLLFKVACSCW